MRVRGCSGVVAVRVLREGVSLTLCLCCAVCVSFTQKDKTEKKRETEKKRRETKKPEEEKEKKNIF